MEFDGSVWMMTTRLAQITTMIESESEKNVNRRGSGEDKSIKSASGGDERKSDGREQLPRRLQLSGRAITMMHTRIPSMAAIDEEKEGQ